MSADDDRIRKGLRRVRFGTIIGVIYVAVGFVLLPLTDDWRLPLLFLLGGIGLSVSGVLYLTEYQRLVKQRMRAR